MNMNMNMNKKKAAWQAAIKREALTMFQHIKDNVHGQIALLPGNNVPNTDAAYSLGTAFAELSIGDDTQFVYTRTADAPVAYLTILADDKLPTDAKFAINDEKHLELRIHAENNDHEHKHLYSTIVETFTSNVLDEFSKKLGVEVN